MKVNYASNRIHEIAFRLDLSTQIKKNLSLDELLITNYFFLLFICTFLVIWALVLISHTAFSLGTIF